MNGFYRGRGGRVLFVAAVVYGVLSAALYVMHREATHWVFIPAIVLGAGILLAVLLFKLMGPLS